MYTSLPSSLHVWQSFITIGWCQKVGVFVLLLGLCLAMAICHRSQSVHSYNSGQKSCITTIGWCQKVVVPVLQAQLTATGSNSRLCIGSFFHSGIWSILKSCSGTVATLFTIVAMRTLGPQTQNKRNHRSDLNIKTQNHDHDGG